jgi:hypothetical protein
MLKQQRRRQRGKNEKNDVGGAGEPPFTAKPQHRRILVGSTTHQVNSVSESWRFKSIAPPWRMEVFCPHLPDGLRKVLTAVIGILQIESKY